jgi:hypothetical protein
MSTKRRPPAVSGLNPYHDVWGFTGATALASRRRIGPSGLMIQGHGKPVRPLTFEPSIAIHSPRLAPRCSAWDAPGASGASPYRGDLADGLG